jgi:hypothetical protein
MFKEPNLSCVGWKDASDHALGGIIVTILDNGDGQMPVSNDGRLGVGWSRCAANSL